MEKSMSRTGVQQTNEKIGMCRSDSIMFEDFLKNLKNMQVILWKFEIIKYQFVSQTQRMKNQKIERWP